MQPRQDDTRYSQQAVVDPTLCVSCGICVGACPTATPFRTATALSPGIDLPDLNARMLRDAIDERTAALTGAPRILVVGCDGSGALRGLKGPATALLGVRCAAQLPPPFVDYVLSRDLADGVFFAGCNGGDCRYRLGDSWTEARMQRTRDPRLRQRIDAQRIGFGWSADAAGIPVASALAAFRERLAALGGRPPTATRDGPASGRLRPVFRTAAAAVFAALAATFSAWPAIQLSGPDEAVVSLSFTHAGQRVGECRQLTQEELNQLPPNMRKPVDCPRERYPLEVEFRADDDRLYRSTLQPSGLWHDGEANVYARFTLPAGTHTLFIGMSDSGRQSGFDHQREETVELSPGQHLVIDFDGANAEFRYRQN